MRAVLPLALVFALAGAVEAQEVPQSAVTVEAAEAVQPVQAFQPKPALERAPLLQPEYRTHTADGQEIDASQRQLESRTAEAALARQAPGTTNWWWLVAAIVVGGLIIVALT
jgi:membrane-bound lytic murein transglycosylase B